MVSVVNIRRQEAGESLSLPPLKPPQNNWTLSGPPKSQRLLLQVDVDQARVLGEKG